MEARVVVPPAQGNNARQGKAAALFTLCALLEATFPGALIGAGIAYVLWRITTHDIVTRWLLAALSASTAAALQPASALVWSWPVLGEWLMQSPADDISPHAIIASLPGEMLLGPLLLVAAELGLAYRRDTIHGEEWTRFNQVAKRKTALRIAESGVQSRRTAPARTHPSGAIRLGMSTDDERPFDLNITNIGQHVFVPGASGTGKTTTLVRLADGALASGYGVVIIDCKGVGLGGEARRLASQHNVRFTIVDPQDRGSAGYDPCSGDPPTIANKLIGSFSFSGEAEIYKQVAMEVIPVICRAMDAAGIDITLDSIYQALARGGLSRLARSNGAEAYRDRLEDMEASGGVAAAGYVGLQKRLGALMEGAFGDLFRKRPALDWRREMSEPRVTYVSLSSTAASEDVELFGRVITQDLKQVCGERMRAIERGEDPIPVLIIYDEFAALREAQQIVDLLLQARQARAPLVVATQYLPEEVAIRKPVLSAGVLIVHRIEAEDAELVASQFGTHTSTAVTAQVNYDEGTSEMGSVRWTEEYNIHPNDLKSLPVGMAAVYDRRMQRQAVVRIYRPS
jgi:hypothetical protein